MPLLPALAAAFGIGLHCINTRKPFHEFTPVCNEELINMGAATWEKEYAALPDKIRMDLQEYEHKFARYLADYSKFCSINNHKVGRIRNEEFLDLPFLAEPSIARIFCPHRYLRAKCGRAYPVYAKIRLGIDKMDRGCLHRKRIIEWDDVTKLVEQTTSQEVQRDQNEAEQ